jgi:hypothetical protein
MIDTDIKYRNDQPFFSFKKIESVFRSLSAQEEICIQIYVNYPNYE